MKTLALSDNNDKKSLLSLYNGISENSDKVIKVIGLYEKYDIPQLIKSEINSYTNKSFNNSNDLSISQTKKKMLIDFGNDLMNRTI